jgi:disulfide bond formation protein DsbB
MARTKWLVWFVAAGLLLAGLIFQVTVPDTFAVQCLFQRLFLIPCPTCGTTRAIRLLFAADWREAFLMQPLVFVGPGFILAAAGVFRLWKRGRPAVKCRLLIGTAAVLLAVNWVYLIVVNRGNVL